MGISSSSRKVLDDFRRIIKSLANEPQIVSPILFHSNKQCKTISLNILHARHLNNYETRWEFEFTVHTLLKLDPTH